MILYKSIHIGIHDDHVHILGNGVEGTVNIYLSREDVRAMIDWVNGEFDIADEDVENSPVKNSEISK